MAKERYCMNVFKETVTDKYSIYNADCVEVSTSFPDESIDFSIFSPPYVSLYVYSNSVRDMGNNKDDKQFYQHFSILVDQLFRIMKKGRIVAVDCMNVPAMKERDGYIGLKDFRGDLIRMFIEKGFIFHSEHCMWKDPLIEATRTKALGLMHKQLCKDSTMSRAGIPQYLLAFRKPGVNEFPVYNEKGLEYFIGENGPTKGTLSHERWRRYASPVWMDIDFSNTLNARVARDSRDERHVCPMSMDIIGRGVQLWSKEGDVVFSPFMGIGSEGYVSLEMKRRFVGVELKESYYDQSEKNLRQAASMQQDLFSGDFDG